MTFVLTRDGFAARQRARRIAALLGFDPVEQSRFATAVSEIVGNACRHAGGGCVTFSLDTAARPPQLVAEITDRGPGIPQLDEILSLRHDTPDEHGLGIPAVRRLIDNFGIRTSPDGTRVVLGKALPAGIEITAPLAGALAKRAAEWGAEEEAADLWQQHRELLLALTALQRKQTELQQLSHELEDTNRGVVALHAELEDKADHLRRADELKSRFLSNMTHEFRTPLNAIVGLCNLLIDERLRDARDAQQEVVFIRTAAHQLADLVDDLLDLAKVEAGKTTVRAAPLDLADLFGALRGMLRPLLQNPLVALVFEHPHGMPVMHTDEAKVAQILRNLISNALKFTERGEVRVAAHLEGADRIVFSVMDTGIGIPARDHRRIFEEFTQLEHRLQQGVRGTGLGLSLSNRLAELLGGDISMESWPGAGSIFRVRLPLHYRPSPESFDAGRLPQPPCEPVLSTDGTHDGAGLRPGPGADIIRGKESV